MQRSIAGNGQLKAYQFAIETNYAFEIILKYRLMIGIFNKKGFLCSNSNSALFEYHQNELVHTPKKNR